MEAIDKYFAVVLFIMLYKVGLTYKSVDEILKCGHSSEIYRAALFFITIHYTIQGGSYCCVLLLCFVKFACSSHIDLHKK